MPKGTKDHREKKNSQSHEAWIRRNHQHRVADDQHQWFQNNWRRNCLSERMGTERFTAKNQKEADAIGLKGVIRFVGTE